MANLSQQKRERILAFLDTLKKKNADDDDTLRAIGEIENGLNSKNTVSFGKSTKKLSILR